MKKRIQLTLDEGIVKQAKKRAVDENTNLSALIEKLLLEYTSEKKFGQYLNPSKLNFERYFYHERNDET